MCYANLDELVRTAGDKEETIRRDIHRVDATRQRAFKVADQTGVIRLKVADLAVGTRGDDLGLGGVVADVLEERVDADHLNAASVSE